MSTRNYAPALLRLAWPVALSRLGIMGMGVTDVIVVGQLAPHDLAPQALGWAPTGVAIVAGVGLLTGVQVLAARAIGQGDPQAAGGAWRRGLLIGLIAGLAVSLPLFFGAELLLRFLGIAPALAHSAAAVTAVLAVSLPFHLLYNANSSFLEAIKRPLPGTAAMWAANVLNLVLNLWLVPEHGAIGSAWSTVVSRIALAGGLGLYIWFLRDGEALGLRRITASAPSFRALLAIGMAAMVSQIVEAGAFSAMTVIAGRIGEEAVATYQIVLNILAVVFMVAMGLSTATAVLVSEAIGRRAPADASRAGWTGLSLNTAAMLIAAAIVVLFANQIGRAFTVDVQIALMVAALAPVAALVTIPDGGQVVAAQALRARGDNWFPTFSHILAYAAVMPPLAFWLAEMHGQGVAGLLYAIFWASVLSFAVLLARFWMLSRRDGRALAAAE